MPSSVCLPARSLPRHDSGAFFLQQQSVASDPHTVTKTDRRWQTHNKWPAAHAWLLGRPVCTLSYVAHPNAVVLRISIGANKKYPLSSKGDIFVAPTLRKSVVILLVIRQINGPYLTIYQNSGNVWKHLAIDQNKTYILYIINHNLGSRGADHMAAPANHTTIILCAYSYAFVLARGFFLCTK